MRTGWPRCIKQINKMPWPLSSSDLRTPARQVYCRARGRSSSGFAGRSTHWGGLGACGERGRGASIAHSAVVEAEHLPRAIQLELLVASQRMVEVLRRDPAVGGLEQQDRLGSGRGEASELGEYQCD